MAKRAPHRPYQVQVEIKAAMKLRSMTGVEVARRVGLSAGYVTLLLNGFQFSEPALLKIGKLVSTKPKL